MANSSFLLAFFCLILLSSPPLSSSSSLPPSLVQLHNSLKSFHLQLPAPRFQIKAAQGVLRRLLPNHTSSFDFRIISEEECGGKACFVISNSPIGGKAGSPKIRISGSTGVEISAGLHWYLKYWCGGHLSWKNTGGQQLNSIPEPGNLPLVNSGGVKIQRPVPWNYYQNVVTVSYSSVWWDWKRWEEEIDWMALQGINLPLAFTGQEAIWQKVFERFNLSKMDLYDFFGGPAFLAWARMGNLHGIFQRLKSPLLDKLYKKSPLSKERWGGPLPQAWLDGQLALQKRILAQMIQLGMTPVLPAFSGNVPSALQTIFPSANITQLGDWNTVDGDTRWCCTYLLDPNDELFLKIGKAFVQQQMKEYGWTSHIYNCDTFNENEPPTNDTSYISSLGAAVFNAMQAGDDEAVWLMQGWLFSSDSSFWNPPQMQALLHSVPIGRMVVLDLFAEVKPIWESSNHFYGTPYIWCMLHNFGGNIEMYGILDNVASGPFQARTSFNSTMVGVGMCMEGIEQNPVVYDLMGEMAFHMERVDVKKWVDLYSSRRYGKPTEGAQYAWQTLYESIYNCTDGAADHNTDVIVEFPDLDATDLVLDGVPGHLWYSTTAAWEALDALLGLSNSFENISTYRYDVVDLTRQNLAKFGNQVYYEIIEAYKSGTYEDLKQNSKIFLELISDMEVLLGSNDCFLLGSWLESAKALATDANQLQRYEWNARTQVTMWFDNTDELPSQLHDYANKYWSGLVGDYYLPRASLYIGLLQKSMQDNTSFPFEEWRKEWIFLTNTWQASTNLYPLKPRGDSLQIAASLSEKYAKHDKASQEGLLVPKSHVNLLARSKLLGLF